VTTKANTARPNRRWLRWLIAVATLLASLAVPACSGKRGRVTGTACRREGAATSAAPTRQGEGRASPPAAATSGVSRKAAEPPPGPPRRHPFAPVNDAARRRALCLAGLGTLELKGIVCGPTPTAIIAEGGRVHYLAEGESLGSLTVLEVREDEVVLGAGRQKRILSLYDPRGPTR